MAFRAAESGTQDTSRTSGAMAAFAVGARFHQAPLACRRSNCCRLRRSPWLISSGEMCSQAFSAMSAMKTKTSR